MWLASFFIWNGRGIQGHKVISALRLEWPEFILAIETGKLYYKKRYTLFVEKTGERCYYKDVDRTNVIHVNSIEFYSGSRYK